MSIASIEDLKKCTSKSVPIITPMVMASKMEMETKIFLNEAYDLLISKTFSFKELIIVAS